MKAEIKRLWDTSIDIITSTDEDEEIGSIKDLRRCDNVVVGDRRDGTWEVLVDDHIWTVTFRTMFHPTGCGRLRICEVL